MKVLYLTYSPTPYRVDFFNELGKLCDLTVLYELKKPSNRDEKWNSNVSQTYKEVFLKGLKVKENSQVCFSIIKYLKDKTYDLIVIGGYSTPTGMIAIEYLNLTNKKFILNCDGGFIKDDSKIKFRIKKHFISSATWWLSSGKVTNNYLIHYGADKSGIFNYPFTSLKEEDIIKNHINEEEKQILKNELDIKEDKVIISIGRFIKIKGFDTLIKSCKYIDESVGVYIIGGEETDEYSKLVKSLNLNNVHFRGFYIKDELKKFYKIADIFVFPTRGDIWGLVINEAMAFGLPIITTDKCVAGLELVKESNGHIVPVDSEEELGKSIMSIIENDKVMKNMSSESLDTIKDYTIENMAKNHIDIFTKVLNGGI